MTESTVLVVERKMDTESKMDVLILMVENLHLKFNELAKRVNDLGNSCKIGFEQTRDAAHVLREDIAEASGCIIEETWN